MTGQPRIWDTFMLRDELDMLECRLRELEGTVYRHVIVESPVSHRGDPKPLAFSAVGRERFARWADRIIHVVADLPDLPGPADAGEDAPDPEAAREHKRLEAWMREHAQRDAALPYLAEAANDDIILISDVDEFPPKDFHVKGPAVSFSQQLAMYAVDWLYPERHTCSVAAKAWFVRHMGLANVRDARGSFPVIEGGWHLTWLGGEEGQRQKLAVTCHLEMTGLSKELLASGRCYREGIHHTGDFQMVPVDVDETWPRWIWERKCPENWFRPR